MKSTRRKSEKYDKSTRRKSDMKSTHEGRVT